MGRLEKLRELEGELRGLMGKASSRSFAALSREYRAVIAEIDELEGCHDEDAVAAIIAASTQGRPGADEARRA